MRKDGSMKKTQLLLAQCGRVLREGADGLFIHLLTAGCHRPLRRRLHCCQQQGTWKYGIAAFVIKLNKFRKHTRWNPSVMAYVQDLCLKLRWASLASSSGTKAHSWLITGVQCKPNYALFFFQKRAIKAQKPAKIVSPLRIVRLIKIV